MKRIFLAIWLGVLAMGSATETGAEVKKLVMVAGTPSHGPGDHEFNAGALLLKACLDRVPGIEAVVHTSGWPKDAKAFEGAHAVFLYMDGGSGHPAIQPENLKTLRGLMEKGVGLGCAHYAVEVPKGDPGMAFQEWIGGHYEHLYSCNPMWNPEFESFPDHPITRGVKPFSVRDEWYFNMRFRPEMRGVTPILFAKPSDEVRRGPYVYPKGPYPHIVQESGRAETMMWAVEREDGGRGFGFTGGHIHKNWGNENFRKTILNALLWVSQVPVPANGVESTVSAEELGRNLDPVDEKGRKKR